jgi:hypothetical protein
VINRHAVMGDGAVEIDSFGGHVALLLRWLKSQRGITTSVARGFVDRPNKKFSDLRIGPRPTPSWSDRTERLLKCLNSTAEQREDGMHR